MRQALLITFVVAAGCTSCPEEQDLFHEPFDDDCDGAPCGWTADVGALALTETFHSGERGMRLSPGTVAVRLFESRERVAIGTAARRASFLARCERAELRMLVVHENAAGARLTHGIGAPADAFAMDPAAFVGFEGRLVPPLAPDEGPPLEIQIFAAGEGDCVVDDVRILPEPVLCE